MTLVRWQPFRNFPMTFNALTNVMNRMFEDFASDEPVSWVPRVDVTETENSFEVTAELPGIDRDDVKVTVQNNILTISGEKKASREKSDRNVYMCERVFGNFSRSFELPSQVKSDEIKAVYKNGVLTLTLPKVEEAKPRQIEVKVA